MCFTEEDIASLRCLLLDASRSKHELLCALRKLDCYRLELTDLERSGIGGAVSTLTMHPKPEVARFAAALLDKLRAVAESTLFPRVPYDVVAAAAAPDGEAQTPEEAIAIAARLAKAERRARQIEAQQHAGRLEILSSSDDEDEDVRARATIADEDWMPLSHARRQRTNELSQHCEQGTAFTPWQNPLAAKYAIDSAFRKTRAGSRVALGTEPASDGRMYRQARLAFGQPNRAPPEKDLQPHTQLLESSCSAMVVEEDLVVAAARGEGRTQQHAMVLD